MTRLSFIIVFLLVLGLLIGCAPSFDTLLQQGYQYTLDLTNVEDDKLAVTLEIQLINKDTLIFCMPKIVPGIYGAMDFGQYVTEFYAEDVNGVSLHIHRLDTNRWVIINSDRALKKITYKVNDVWEQYDNTQSGNMYRSAGSSFQSEAVVINHNGLFGYLEGWEELPVSLEITKPSVWYAATSLQNQSKIPEVDHFLAKDYHSLVDAPILYSEPDTASILLEDIKVQVACYSSTGQSIAEGIANFITPLLENQRAYLGGKLPVSAYTFIIYHHQPNSPEFFMADGLEHNTSTLILFYLPLDEQTIQEMVYSIASHEFFHTLMPLSLHAHEIADYDYVSPEMSKHLWLYEGTTEYFTMHMPVTRKVQSLEEFCGVIENKARQMKGFDNSLPLTQLSKQAMERQDQYYNFYLRGALVNLCLDILLREESNGTFGVNDLIQSLISAYGPDRPFEDDSFLDEVAQRCVFAPEKVRTFLRNYLQEGQTVPLATYLEKVGIRLDPQTGEVTPFAKPSSEQVTLREAWLRHTL
ncbi:MAG: hypothetical protein HRU12_21195 [Phaeodactylibacter sp.]|nr:hypothetical protein [Phaeodactylibacter sp.]